MWQKHLTKLMGCLGQVFKAVPVKMGCMVTLNMNRSQYHFLFFIRDTGFLTFLSREQIVYFQRHKNPGGFQNFLKEMTIKCGTNVLMGWYTTTRCPQVFIVWCCTCVYSIPCITKVSLMAVWICNSYHGWGETGWQGKYRGQYCDFLLMLVLNWCPDMKGCKFSFTCPETKYIPVTVCLTSKYSGVLLGR